MRKILIVFIIFLPSLLVYAQFSIDSIKAKYLAIDGKFDVTGKYELNRDQAERIKDVLNLDLFGYYSMSEYNSDLKRHMFSKTDEYRKKLDSLKLIKSKLLNSYYYLDADINSRNHYAFKYNLFSKTFMFTIELYSEDFYKTNIIQFDKICFKKPRSFSIEYEYINNPRVGKIIRQCVYFKVDNHNVALKMENSNENLRLLFIFHFISEKTYSFDISDPSLGNSFTTYSYWLLTNLYEVIAYDSKTGEVFSEYNITKLK